MNQKNKELLRKANQVLKSEEEIKGIIGEGGFKRMRKTVKIIENDLESDFPMSDNNEIEFVNNTLNLFINFILNRPIPKIIYEISQSFFGLVITWGENVVDNKDITLKTALAVRLLKLQNKMNESIKIIKNSNKKIKDITSFNPEAFEVSEEFLQKMKEKVSKQKKERNNSSHSKKLEDFLPKNVVNSLKEEGVKSTKELEKVINKNEEKLLEVKGIGKKRIKKIKENLN